MKTTDDYVDRETSASASQAKTLSSEVGEKLRLDILSSRLAPGTKLRLDDLKATYGVGASPLREALARLAESRLVLSVGQRGFRVPAASPEDIMDIAMVRTEIEGLALRRSITFGDDAWEARVVAARHKLNLCENHHSHQVTEDIWEQRHREFHYAIVSACNSEWLLHLHRLLVDQFDRYRRLSAESRLPNAPRPLVHQEIMDAALNRQTAKAVKLASEHIAEATNLIVSGLGATAGSKKKKTRKKA